MQRWLQPLAYERGKLARGLEETFSNKFTLSRSQLALLFDGRGSTCHLPTTLADNTPSKSPSLHETQYKDLPLFGFTIAKT
ncbi:hypothetical protein K505DRAFT_116861 [Melanomma pulvis-pyrius CBS 109.77]|uniref:Uncharacterized protein n=1 Tax=Melanomma pulvis-pyrius CBS 109.77 TaxID=1314802 RepID=A0A6A6WW16_9PLEO|nr:hypothetical protein K505DRAFT_116861 [Melanomma pulvis-pyrius CBS 109.77]